MVDVTHAAKDIGDADRQSLEHLVGTRLRDDQHLVIRVVDSGAPVGNDRSQPKGNPPELPAWCAVYEGLSDEEITDLERTVLRRADLSRTFDN